MAYRVVKSENINGKKNIYTYEGTGTKPEGDHIAENSKLTDLSQGKVYYYDPTKADGSKWQPLKSSEGGSSGGGLPADFPAEGSANANKYVGFDANGDYTAKDAPSGGGAEKFVVTFTEQNGEITADKTLAEIIEAKEAGDIVVGVYTSSGVPCEIPCVTAVEMQIEGQAFPVAAFAGPIVGEHTKIATISGISGIPDGGSDEWGIGFSEVGGEVSYNDLEDKPFYEETVSPSINYAIPYKDGSNPDKSYQIPFAGDTAYAYLYRVGDALTASQLEGATVSRVSSTQSGDETSTLAITSNNITEVTNGRYVMSDGFPLVFVADIDGVDIDIQGLTNFKNLEAGTYLIYIDADIVQSGARLYAANLSKAAVTTVHKLNAKFYDSYAPLIVTLAFDDPSEPTAFVGDKTYGEVFTAVSAGTPCTLVLSADGASIAMPVVSAVSSDGTIMLFTYDTDSSSITSIQGSASDNVTIAIS